MRKFEFFRVEGDQGPPVLFTYQNTDITAWTLQMLVVYRNTRRRIYIDATAIDLSAGQVAFGFAAGDLVEGVADVEFQLTPPSGDLFTVPSCDSIRMTVRKDLG